MSVFDQSFSQVRLDWGVAGLHRLAPSDVVVVVDVLLFSTAAVDAVAAGHTSSLTRSASVNGAPVAAAAAGPDALVLAGCLRNASAVARAIAAEQDARHRRLSVAVVPAGERMRDAGGVRFAIEDELGAGAIVAALGDLGTDHTSPEAAVAAEAFRGLRRGVQHLVTASGSGQELIALGRHDRVAYAATVDAADVVPVLRDGAFLPL